MNSKRWGLKGDGSTDDLTQGNLMMAAAGRIEFTDGTYIVSASLAAASNSEITIRPDATIKGKASTSFIAGLIKCSSVNDVTICGGGLLDGNEPNNGTGRVFGVEITGCSRIRVSGLRLKDMPSEGSWYQARSDAPLAPGGGGAHLPQKRLSRRSM
jgi:hypothetical protein